MHSGRVLLTTLLTAALALGGSVSSVAAGPLKAPPRIPWYDAQRERIVVPGGDPVSTVDARGPHGGRPAGLLEARGGYLLHVTVNNKDETQIGSRVTFINNAGRARTLVANSRYYPVLTSSDGRTAVLRSWASEEGLRAVRISDGRVLDAYKPTRSEVKAASEHHVLVQRLRYRGDRTYTVEVVSWNPTRGTTEVIDRRTVEGDPFAGVLVPAAASPETRRYATYSGDHAVMVRSRTHRTLWRTRTGEVPVAFSPDNKRVATIAGLRQGDEDYYSWTNTARTVRVRNATTGAVLATYTGRFMVEGPDQRPLWESSDRLFLQAVGNSFPLLRCSVASDRCARVQKSVGPRNLMVRKSN